MPDTSTLNTTASMPIEVKTYYDRLLLERALPNLPFLKYGQKKPIPKGNGKTIEFRKFTDCYWSCNIIAKNEIDIRHNEFAWMNSFFACVRCQYFLCLCHNGWKV